MRAVGSLWVVARSRWITEWSRRGATTRQVTQQLEHGGVGTRRAAYPLRTSAVTASTPRAPAPVGRQALGVGATPWVRSTVGSTGRLTLHVGLLAVAVLGLVAALPTDPARGRAIGVAIVMGVTVVAGHIAHSVSYWVGWQVVLPLFLGHVPSRVAVGPSRARCTGCLSAISPGGLPAIGWLSYGGRCRRCGHPIAAWVGLLEVATGVTFGWVAWRAGWSWPLPLLLVLAAGLVAICAVDLVYARIPTRMVVATAIGCVTVELVHLAAVQDPTPLVASGLASTVYGGGMGLIHLARPAALGFGDVRLCFLLGLALGWGSYLAEGSLAASLGAVTAAAMASCLLATATHVVLAVTGSSGWRRALPFGPALGVGALLVASSFPY